jgi:hypothetical protein
MPSSTRTAAGVLALSFAFAGFGAPRAGEPADAGITLRAVKYSDLCRTIRSHTGKVVFVDFWAEY